MRSFLAVTLLALAACPATRAKIQAAIDALPKRGSEVWIASCVDNLVARAQLIGNAGGDVSEASPGLLNPFRLHLSVTIRSAWSMRELS